MCFKDFLKSITKSGVERPTPSDIFPTGNIKITADGDIKIKLDNSHIPFTKKPIIQGIMEIPNSNSMDGVMDYGHNPLYIMPADEANHQILVDWLANEYLVSGGLNANDCVYRIMADDNDEPSDFSAAHIAYIIHRIYGVNEDSEGRYFTFMGVNNHKPDSYKVRDKNILYFNGGVIY